MCKEAYYVLTNRLCVYKSIKSIISVKQKVKIAILSLLPFQGFKNFKDSSLFSEQSCIFELVYVPNVSDVFDKFIHTVLGTRGTG